MAIKALKDGRYQVDIRPQGAEGKRIRKIFTLKSKAQDYEKYVLQNFHNKPWLEKPADKRHLSNWRNGGGFLMAGYSLTVRRTTSGC